MWHLMEQRIRAVWKGGTTESDNVVSDWKSMAEEELWVRLESSRDADPTH